MTTLHIITPVSRPQNIPALAQSIKSAIVPDITVEWWLVYDAAALPSELPQSTCHFLAVPSVVKGNKISVAGNAQYNAALDKISDGWVYFLDDDTTLHHRLIKAIAPLLLNIPGCNIAFNQNLPDGTRRLTVSPDNMRVNAVDTGQVVLCRESIGNIRRTPADAYCGDGRMIEAVFKAHPNSFIFLNETLSVYNRLK